MDLKALDQPVKIGAFADRPKPMEPEPVDIPFSNLVYTPQQSPTAAPDSSSGGGSLGSGGGMGARTNDNTSVNTADSDNGNLTPQNDEPFILLDLVSIFCPLTITNVSICPNQN